MRVLIALCLAALTGAAFTGSANAARVPKKSELEWVLKEFKADSKDKGAVISFVRISTVNPKWADVQYFPKPGKTAGVPIACADSGCCSTCGGVKAKERTVKQGSGSGKPPKRVQKDFKKPFLAHIRIQFRFGKETGRSTHTYGECGTITRSLDANFYGGVEYDVDLRHEQFIFRAGRVVGYVKPTSVEAVPGVSDIAFKYQNDTQTDSNGKHCVGQPSDHCDATGGVPDQGSLGLFSSLLSWWRQSNYLYADMTYLMSGSWSRCRANGFSTPRVAGYGGDMQVNAPFFSLGPDALLNLGEHPIDYEADSGRTQAKTVHDTAWCTGFGKPPEGDSESCSDTIDWAGFLTISVPKKEKR